MATPNGLREKWLALKTERRALNLLFLRVLAAFANAGLPLLVAYLASPTVYGKFLFAAATGITFDAIAQVFIGTTLARGVISGPDDAGRSAKLSAQISMLCTVSVVAGLASAVIFLSREALSLTVVGLIIWPILIAIVRVTELLGRRDERPGMAFMVSQILPPVVACAGVLIIWASRLPITSDNLILVFLAGFILSIAVKTGYAREISAMIVNGWIYVRPVAMTVPLLLALVPVVFELLPIYILGGAREYNLAGTFDIVRRFAWAASFASGASWNAFSIDYARQLAMPDSALLWSLIKRHRSFLRPVGAASTGAAFFGCSLYFGVTGRLTPSIAAIAAAMIGCQLLVFVWWPASLLPLMMHKIKEYYLVTILSAVCGITAALFLHQHIFIAAAIYWVLYNTLRGVGYAAILRVAVIRMK
jgi:hypothetical protein